jgi:uncharacterized protein (DUF2267 family)
MKKITRRKSSKQNRTNTSADKWTEQNELLRGPGKMSPYDLHSSTSTRNKFKIPEVYRNAVRLHHDQKPLHETKRKFIYDRFEVPGMDLMPPVEIFAEQHFPRKRRSPHFEKYAENGNRFINEVADELDIDDGIQALRISKAVLHAVRDRLPASDAVQFAQGLPMMIKAIYFDQYDISKTPVLIHDDLEFLEFIREKNRFGAISDFKSPRDVMDALRAVFRVLENNMDYGQVAQIVKLLPRDIRYMIDMIVF